MQKQYLNMGKKIGYKFNLLDIGGGFPGSLDAKPSFIDIAEILSPLIDELFDESVKVIAEPGRYFAHACHTLVSNIHAKREVKILEETKTKQEFLYYVNDGVYHSFSCIFFDHVKAKIVPFSTNKKLNDKQKYKSKVFGPTCDSLDMITADIEMPEMDVGDWIYVDEFGAYTRSSSTAFNGFSINETFYYWKE